MTELHLETHELPVSRGYTAKDDGIYVYCGRCRGSFLADRGWVREYWKYIRYKASGQLERRYISAAELDRYLAMHREKLARVSMVDDSDFGL